MATKKSPKATPVQPVAETPTTEEQTPVSEPVPAAALAVPHEPTYPVTLVLANDGSGGNNAYHVDLTSAQIVQLLRDDESPRFILLPTHYNAIGAPQQWRYVRTSNLSEIHITGGWKPPSADFTWWAD